MDKDQTAVRSAGLGRSEGKAPTHVSPFADPHLSLSERHLADLAKVRGIMIAFRRTLDEAAETAKTPAAEAKIARDRRRLEREIRAYERLETKICAVYRGRIAKLGIAQQ